MKIRSTAWSFILVVVVVVSCSPRFADGVSSVDEPDTRQILASFFLGYEVYHRSLRSANILSYCPDNTCEELVSYNVYEPISKQYDFLYLLFIYANISNHDNMFKFKNSQLPNVVEKILLRNSAECDHEPYDGITESFVRCVIVELQKRGDVEFWFVRYDENTIVFGKTKFEEILDRIHIERRGVKS